MKQQLHAVIMLEYLSEAKLIPPMIVVGDLHSHRIKDLTTTIQDTIDDRNGKDSGGGEQFISFF